MTIQEDSGTHATLADLEDTSDPKELPRGSNLGRYVIIEPIGSGGMGTVYRAYDPQLNRGVALKILSVEHTDLQTVERAKARLIREAQALAQLSHPNVVAVHDAGTFEDDVFIAMELVEGKTLDNWLKEEKRSVKEKLKVMIAAGRGLSAAHKAGLVHRDFKPGNVIVGDDGRVRVLDFGLARAADQQELIEDGAKTFESDEHLREPKSSDNWKEISSDSSPNLLQSPLTRAGGVLGTPLYMAPEQHLGLKTDARTDQFGFSVVLYEALYRERPFAARTLEELKSEVIHQQFRVPPADADIPTWLWEIIRKGLSVNPKNRYATIEALLDDLGEDPQAARASRRKKQLWTMGIILVAIMPFGLWYSFFQGGELCTGADKKISSIWNLEKKENIRQSFAKTGLSYANDTFIRVEKQLGEYFQNWKNDYTETCEATRMRGEQSEEIMDLKMGCLNQHLRNANALARVFAEADKTVVGKAIQAVTSLSGFSNCHDVESLQSRIPPPKDEQTKTKVGDIREKIAEVEAFVKTGKYQKGLKLVNILNEQANALDYRPVQAEVLYHLGALLKRTGDYTKAETTFHKAAYLAGQSRDALLITKAMSQLVWVVGYMQARYEEGLSFGRAAEVMLVFAGGVHDVIWARLFNNLGSVLLTKGDYDKALEHFRNAMKFHEKAFGPGHPSLSGTLNNMGVLFATKRSYDQALEYYHKVLAIREKALGSQHPLVASTYNNIGIVLSNQGDYDKSLECYLRSLAIREKALGPNHPLVATTLNNVGYLFSRKGNYDKAQKHLQRSLTIYEKALGSDHPDVTYPLFNLGEVFISQGKPDKAMECYRKSMTIVEKSLGPDHPLMAWPLNGLGNLYMDLGKPNQAHAPLHRAVRICQKKTCDLSPYGHALFCLARVLVATGGDKQNAIKLAKQAREVFKKTSESFKKELEDVNAWLHKQSVSRQYSIR